MLCDLLSYKRIVSTILSDSWLDICTCQGGYTWLADSFFYYFFLAQLLLYLFFFSGGSATNGTLPRPRLETSALAEIHLQVEIGSRAYSLLANPFDQIQSLKEQIEELTGVSKHSQLLRWNDKPLIMNDFILEDYHIRDNSTIVVQVHPWNEE